MKAKKILLSVLSIICLCFSTLSITSCGNEKYTKSLKFVQHIEDASYAVVGIDKVSKDKNIVIPSVYKKLPVTEIGYEAFVTRSITSVTIPDSITHIGGGAFWGCSSLKIIYYTGTKAQWNKIYIEDYYKPSSVFYHNYGYPENVTIIYDYVPE